MARQLSESCKFRTSWPVLPKARFFAMVQSPKESFENPEDGNHIYRSFNDTQGGKDSAGNTARFEKFGSSSDEVKRTSFPTLPK